MDDHHNRNPHQYMLDGFTEAFLDARSHPDLWDAILVREKDYFYHFQNTNIDNLKEVGRPKNVYGQRKGDWDFAVIYPEIEHVDWYELSKSQASSHSKRHPSEVQEERFRESIDLINKTNNVDIGYETEIFFAEDYDLVFDDHPDAYKGTVAYTGSAQELFDQSEAMQALDECNFKGSLLKAQEIERKE